MSTTPYTDGVTTGIGVAINALLEDGLLPSTTDKRSIIMEIERRYWDPISEPKKIEIVNPVLMSEILGETVD